MNIYKSWLKRNNIDFNEVSMGLLFKYQGGSFVISDNSRDKEYFQLLMPHISEVRNNKMKILEIANIINEEIKCVKCFVVDGDSVWLATEILLDETPEIDSIIPRLLAMLHGARLKFQSLIY